MALQPELSTDVAAEPAAKPPSTVERSDGEKERSVRLLYDSEERFRAVFETASIGKAIIDRDGCYVEVNPAFCRMLGRQVNELVGVDFREHLHPDDEAKNAGPLRKYLAGKIKTHRVERRYVRKDGSVAWALVNVSAVRDHTDRLKYFVVETEHISERRQAQEDLQASRTLISSVLNTVPDGVVALKAVRDDDDCIIDFEFTLANPQTEAITGVPANDMVGRRLIEYAPESRSANEFFQYYVAVVEEGEPFENEVTFEKDGEERLMHFTVVRMMDGIVASFRDVTERRQAEERIERVNETLTVRNRELQEFAHVASHDLQEPLRKIRSFANLLTSEFESRLDADGAFYLDRIEDAARRMSRLISDLLTFSRITARPTGFGKVNLNAVMDQVLSDLALQISEVNGTVEVGELPTLESDETHMRRLMQNLVSNALKFHRRDVPPHVEIHASMEESSGADSRDRPRCRIQVKDNGIGFDEKFVDRIFTPFQRLHGRSAFDGAGMGLAICRRIVEHHGGRISAASVPGEGASFMISIPLRQIGNSPDGES